MHRSVPLLLAGLLAIWGNAPAKASSIVSCLSCEGGSIDFYLGTPLFDNNPGSLPSQADEKKVYLDKNTKNVTSFIGNIDSQTGLPTTQFITDVAVDLGNGFANVKPSDKDAKIGTLTFSVPGYLFGDFLFDVQLDTFNVGRVKNQPYPLSILAYDKEANTLGSWTFGPNDARLKGNADLSFLVLSSLSNIDTVLVKSVLGNDQVHGMRELKHFQVSELEQVSDPVAPVPLPAAFPLFASGLVGMGWFARRKQRKAAAEA
jgi:hypothetical protein